ncbi:DAK2 domain-containing protein [Tissierella creatinophila]|uniref:DegV domain-containing protein n=1 Tax=Tissierella creatinophila DSM 6911 TaxID=1123403 RepID=A0A1U7M6U7_TISCR|nr:DegV family protein [Tissierella creatinophila]OLS03042.1 DegV domain-containing protein [Tissierella creatinophila DSM 6911]
MKFTQINGENIYYGFVSGANEVIKQKLELNRINVFPIADGDTGSNLAYTMNAIIENANIENSPKKTLGSIADAALVGARGNSGIIFAQFVNGMYMELEDKDDIEVVDFANSVKKAGEYAYNAISNPVEGTMITVINDWANSLCLLGGTIKDFSELFTHSLKVALKSLSQTPEKLKVLRDANVVDSGAKGFVHFIEGFLNFIKTGEIQNLKILIDKIDFKATNVHVHENFDLNYRYCSEALLQGKDLDIKKIKKEIDNLGDSLILAGNKNKVRIHIHTSKPEELFFKIRNYGNTIFQKVEDMKRQYESIYDRKSEIALVTDSIADLPKELMDKHQIHLLPLNIIIEDTNYFDKVTISSSHFYELMDKLENYPSSSQPTLKEAEKILKELSAHYKFIIVITVSSKMSGTYEVLKKASENLKKDGTSIEVIDSKLNSGGQGLVVLKAAEEIANGKSFDEVIESVKDTREKTDIFVSVPTLKYMLKSGRIGKAQAIAANIVNLKPVVSIDENGDGIIIGKAFSEKGNTRKIEDLIKEIMKKGNIDKYSLVHANRDERVNEFKEYYTKLIGKEPEYIMEISTIVAMNAGIGSVAISVSTK